MTADAMSGTAAAAYKLKEEFFTVDERIEHLEETCESLTPCRITEFIDFETACEYSGVYLDSAKWYDQQGNLFQLKNDKSQVFDFQVKLGGYHTYFVLEEVHAFASDVPYLSLLQKAGQLKAYSHAWFVFCISTPRSRMKKGISNSYITLTSSGLKQWPL